MRVATARGPILGTQSESSAPGEARCWLVVLVGLLDRGLVRGPAGGGQAGPNDVALPVLDRGRGARAVRDHAADRAGDRRLQPRAARVAPPALVAARARPRGRAVRRAARRAAAARAACCTAATSRGSSPNELGARATPARTSRTSSSIALVAPIVEELTFRGLGYSLLEPFGTVTAILVVGVHVRAQPRPHRGLPRAGALRLRPRMAARAERDSVFPGMAVHATFNAIALIVVVLVA